MFIVPNAKITTSLGIKEKLKEQNIGCSIVNIRFAAPLDKECIVKYASNHKLVVTMEENVHTGGIGQQISDILATEGVVKNFLNCSIPNEFIEHGDVESLKKLVGIDEETIYGRIIEKIGG